jgi:type IV pilus assembly protein PilX
MRVKEEMFLMRLLEFKMAQEPANGGKKGLLNDEEGSVLVVALIMLVLLTLIGISATTTSEIETKISANDRVQKRNLYAAEGAALHGAQDLEGVADPKTTPPAYLHALNTVTDANLRSDAFWDSTAPVNSQVSVHSITGVVSAGSDARFLVTSEGLAGGAKATSLDMTKSNVHAYLIYGRCRRPNSGPTIVEVGYRKAF